MSSPSTPTGPLDGVRVLDLGQVLASPFAGYLLANLGADVIKVEPPGGEWLRRATGGGLAFDAQNSGKRMLCVDLHHPEGAEVVMRLAAGADVLVEGFAPGTADAMGLSFEAVRRHRPDIVYASLSAFGHDGPYGGRPAFDHVVQAVSGIMESTGFPDQPPTKVGAPYVDYGSGLLLAFAVLAGLRHRDQTTEAVQVDITMLDAALLLNLGALVRTANTGQNPPRTGNQAFSSALASGAFETADGLLSIAANKVSHHVRLCDLLGLDELADRTDLAGPEADPEQVDAARAQIAAALQTATARQWEQRLAEVRVPAAAVRRLSDVIDDGHPGVRRLLQAVPDGDGNGAGDGEVILAGSGIRVNGHMAGPAARAGACGADTDGVLTDGGFDRAERARLRAAGVVH